MNDRTKYTLIGMREFALLCYAAFSVFVCYFVAECLPPLIRYIGKVDVVIMPEVFELGYIIPNVLLALALFMVIDKYKALKFRFLFPAQILFFYIHHALLLLLAGDVVSVYWYPRPNEGFSEFLDYHVGMRDYYMNIVSNSKEFYGAYEIWLGLGLSLAMMIGFAMLYRFLQKYIRTKSQTSVFAEPIPQSE